MLTNVGNGDKAEAVELLNSILTLPSSQKRELLTYIKSLANTPAVEQIERLDELETGDGIGVERGEGLHGEVSRTGDCFSSNLNDQKDAYSALFGTEMDFGKEIEISLRGYQSEYTKSDHGPWGDLYQGQQ